MYRGRARAGMLEIERLKLPGAAARSIAPAQAVGRSPGPRAPLRARRTAAGSDLGAV
jgi:hypothetical protein